MNYAIEEERTTIGSDWVCRDGHAIHWMAGGGGADTTIIQSVCHVEGIRANDL